MVDRRWRMIRLRPAPASRALCRTRSCTLAARRSAPCPRHLHPAAGAERLGTRRCQCITIPRVLVPNGMIGI
eukprot:6173652-Pleurochrysis_carterae.AAC.7